MLQVLWRTNSGLSLVYWRCKDARLVRKFSEHRSRFRRNKTQGFQTDPRGLLRYLATAAIFGYEFSERCRLRVRNRGHSPTTPVIANDRTYHCRENVGRHQERGHAEVCLHLPPVAVATPERNITGHTPHHSRRIALVDVKQHPLLCRGLKYGARLREMPRAPGSPSIALESRALPPPSPPSMSGPS